MSFGTLIVNELTYDVRTIRLADGRIFFDATREVRNGSLTVSPGDQAVLLAPDGSEVLKCRLPLDGPYTASSKSDRPAYLTILLPAVIDEVVGRAAWT